MTLGPFATRPVTFLQDTFYEIVPANGTAPIFYNNVQMQWVAGVPGYIVADTTCTMNTLPGPASSEVVGAGCPASQGPALYEFFDPTNNLLPSKQFGFVVLTTSIGIIDHEEARRKHTGGKVLGFFY